MRVSRAKARYIVSRSSSVTISSVSSSWLRRNSAHWLLASSAGVCASTSTMGKRSSVCSAMYRRGMIGKWKAMWQAWLADVRGGVVGPLVGLGEQHAVREFAVDVRAQLAHEGVGLGQVLAARAVALEQVGDGVESQAVDAQLEPEVERAE